MPEHQTQQDAPALPPILKRQEGPFREFDLLAIGSVLLVVLVILGLRKLLQKRR